MEQRLTAQERARLKKRHKKERDKRICDRIKAVLAYDEGYTYSEISRILLLDDETIRRHINDYFSKRKLNPENGGSSSLLNDSDSEKLMAHLEENIYRYVKDICSYVKKTFNVKYSVSGMTKWLQSNGFRYKKPQPVPAKADQIRQEEFVNYYENLKVETAGNEPIYFADSVHPQHQTHLAFGWILKGTRKLMPTTARQYRLNFMGAINLDGHKIVYRQSDKVNTDSIEQFLRDIRSKHRGGETIHLIWDNAGYHRAKKITNFAKKLSIELHYLPPYSPNLNPIERLWKLMHEHVSYNTYYNSFEKFTESTISFFKTISRKKKILRARITDNFQILDAPNFAS